MVTLNTRASEIDYRRRLFEAKFRKGKPNECWPWIAAAIKKGHGIFGMGNLCNAAKPAYVASWMFYVDPTFDLDAPTRFSHMCGNPGCVNPAHLAIFTEAGLWNEKTVLQYIASRNPNVRSELDAVSKKLKAW